MTRFRVLKITVYEFTPNANPTTLVIWEGTDLDELSTKFPKSNVKGADSLGHASIEDGYIHWNCHFEKQVDGGDWMGISDPRHRVYSKEQEDLEAEIDAENRRNFPGDYLEEDDGGSDDWDQEISD